MLQRVRGSCLDLPRSSGTYVLSLFLPGLQTIAVGRLGTFDFPNGYYLYVGSAFGPGGLAARLGRHDKLARLSDKKLHWHIDYLREQAAIVEILYEVGTLRQEHRWATAICQLKRGEILVPRFGASDCFCPTHLIYFPTQPEPKTLQSLL